MIKIAFIILLPILCFAKSEPELVFSSAVEVSPRAELSLYDLVEARNLNEDLISDLKSIQLNENNKQRIEKNELAKMLRHLKAKFVLPSELKIIRSKSAISRMEVERKIKNHIQMNCGDCDMQLQISSVPANMSSDWTLDLGVDLTKNSVMIPIYAQRQSDKKGWIVAEVRRYQKIPVLNHALKIGDVITADMISFEKRMITNVRETAVHMEAVAGMQAARFINAGQPILFSDLKKETVLKKGQMVKAITGNDAFEVSISALVEESGSIGDVIKIKNLDSQKVFAAKVIDRGVVRIE